MEYRKFSKREKKKKILLSFLPSSFKILLNWRILNTFHMIMTHIDNEIRCENCICNRHSWILIRHTSNLIVRMKQIGENEVNEHHMKCISTRSKWMWIFFYRTTYSDMRFQLLLEFWSFFKYSEAIFFIHSNYSFIFSPNQFIKMQSDSIQPKKEHINLNSFPLITTRWKLSDTNFNLPWKNKQGNEW